MTGYIFRRLLWLAPVLIFLALITFLLMHLVPGGPWDTKSRPISPELREQLEAKYGLDEPVWQQFLTFSWNTLHGDLGVSFQYQDRPVTDIIREGVEVSVVLGMLALTFALVVGVTLGVAAAVKQNSVIDYASVFLATVAASTPSFVLGILLIVVFAVQLGWLPVFGWEKTWWLFPDWKQAILPTITLGALPAAYIARMTRASVLDVLQQDYVRTARAKGLQGDRGQEAERILLDEDAALCPLFNAENTWLVKPYVSDFIMTAADGQPGDFFYWKTAILDH